jgi:ERCC4-type nuclease
MTHDSAKTITAPFTLLVDTREQLPYTFDNIEVGGKRVIVPVERGTLASGDYSIKGLENLVAVERKAVADFYGSITSGRERLEAEFMRMESMEFSAIVIEGRFETVLDSLFHGRRVSPNAIRATVASWSIKFKTRWFFSTSRDQAERLTLELLEKFYRHYTKNNAPETAITGAK